MSLAMAFATVVALAYAAWCFVSLLWARGRRKSKLVRGGVAFVATIVFAIVGSSLHTAELVSAGWDGAVDKAAAEKAGFTDPMAWAKVKDTDAATFAKAKAVADNAQRIADEITATRAAEAEKRKADDAAAAAKVEEGKLIADAKAKLDADAAKDDECRKDLHCWAEKSFSYASVFCRAPVEKLAKWDFEWTDGWTEPRFSGYRWKDQKAGIVTYVGDKLKLQNGFGAWKHVRYSCDVDVKAEAVVDVAVYE